MADDGTASAVDSRPDRIKRPYVLDRVLELVQVLPTGSAIPSERELAQRFGVSRMTLRSAVDDLVRDGYLSRRHGSGTYVSKPKIAKQIYLTSFSEDMRSRGLTASTRVISMARKAAGAKLGARLRVSPDEMVLTAGRLRLADDDPMALEWLTIPDRLVPGLTREDLAGSFYLLLGERYGITVEGGQQTIEPTVTDEDESALLGVSLHSPALFVERVTWTAELETIEFVETIYRGDRYRFSVDLTRPHVRSKAGGQ